uniref:UBX domain-containing protein 1-A-like n=1 Tax=Saccoglossus kowalevskii TaxID=10224 RepID=A0ABM0GL96_SACKO|nr:PREDICTED: UBX domain-containing protein 1-A-like [Saccoglossus kowalevskii]
MIKIAQQKKKEKMEEKLARQKVKEQIAQDRAERAAKTSGAVSPQQTATTLSPAAPVESPPKKEYNEARLQIRLPNGSAITQTFGASEPLSAVRLYVQLNRGDGDVGPFSLMTTFPRKIFKEDDMETPLKELGLVPSSVVMVTKQ